MHLEEIRELIESTADPAFAIDVSGLIVAWNQAAEIFFGIAASEAIGQPCWELVGGTDESGPICSADCVIRREVHNKRPVANSDIQVNTRARKIWCNISVLLVKAGNSRPPYSIHIIHSVDFPKRLELLVRDFLISQTDLSGEQVRALIHSRRAAARHVELTPREREVLCWLARGASTASIAQELHISRTTVNNHVQHLLQKLDAHTRLEAIRRAERAGLI